jgi:hypothetical protein
MVLAEEACVELTKIYAFKMSKAPRKALVKAINQSLYRGLAVVETLKAIAIFRDPSSVPAIVRCLRSHGFESKPGRSCAALLTSFGTKYARQALADELKDEQLSAKHLDEFLQSNPPGRTQVHSH